MGRKQRPLDSPLTDRELDRLDEILLNHVDQDAWAPGKDEGLICISELDGFLTAIVSGPGMVMPSVWLPDLWGDFEPVWNSMRDYEEFMSLLMRHMNGISGTLMNDPESFEPIFMENRAATPPALVVDEWCEGYLRAVRLTPEAWADGGAAMQDLLAPIRAFTEESEWAAHELGDSAEALALRDAITPNARAIHAFWLAQRTPRPSAGAPVAGTPVAGAARTVVRDAPRVGRNDPCPCGSGKKYKKCCLQ